jgi:hypothetical protein
MGALPPPLLLLRLSRLARLFDLFDLFHLRRHAGVRLAWRRFERIIL